MKTKVDVVSQIKNGKEVSINQKGLQTIDNIDILNDINCFTINNKHTRLIGINKNLYRLSLKSFKTLKKELISMHSDYRFDNLRQKKGA